MFDFEKGNGNTYSRRTEVAYARQPVNQENDSIENLLITIKIPWISPYLPQITRK
jgi:hypothetical protein